MNKHNYLLSLVFFSMMVAVGVVISPILRVEGMCPMAHLIISQWLYLWGLGIHFFVL